MEIKRTDESLELLFTLLIGGYQTNLLGNTALTAKIKVLCISETNKQRANGGDCVGLRSIAATNAAAFSMFKS